MKTLSIPPADPNAKPLEFITFNVGEGAFHWIRHNKIRDHAGWIYDCGTRSGKKLIKNSLAMFSQTIAPGTTLPLLMVSHYHVDHHSHLKHLVPLPLKSLTQLKVKEIWIPEIDPYSMALYLRMLAIGNLFKYRNSVVADRELTRMFSKREHLKHDLSILFPDTEVKLVKKGEKESFPAGEDVVEVKALTPSSFPDGRQHPLAAVVDEASSILRHADLAGEVEKIIEGILKVAAAKPSLKEYLNTFWRDDDLIQEMSTEKVMMVLQNPPFPPEIREHGISYQDQDKGNRILHMWLALCSFVTDKDVPRLPLAKKDTMVPHPFRSRLRALPQEIHDATHLFNLVIEVSDMHCSYLLTGDADVRLWPAILEGCAKVQSAVQVAHHGSLDNVGAFDKLRINSFIVSAGKYKNWKHPSEPLGSTISKGTGRLYCTNVHDNCGIMAPEKKCRENSRVVEVISVAGKKVECVIAGKRCPGFNCPRV